MKKLIAISVVFALVLGAAFAQPSLGGNFKVGTPLLNGQSENEVDSARVYAGGTTIDSAHMDGKFGDADAGGLIRFYHNPNESTPGYQPVFAFVWWRPIPQLRLQMGRNPDGDWGHQNIAGWGYDSESKSVGVAISQYNDQPPLSKLPADNNAWGPGFGALGMTISLYPIDGLQVNLGIPYESGGRAGKIYSNMYLDAKFALDGIGTVMAAAKFRDGNTNRYVLNEKEVSGEEKSNDSWRGNNEAHDPMSIWLAFHLTAIEGVGVDIGAGFTLPYTTQDVKYVADPLSLSGRMVNVGGIGYNKLPVNAKVNAPITVGLGAQYGAGDFGVKARAAFKFAGSTSVDVSTNEGYANQKKSLETANKPFDHIPLGALYLNSDTFTEVRTTKSISNGVLYDVVSLDDRSGTQEKKADPFEWGFNVKPTYKLGNITVHLNLGIGMKHYAKQEVKVVKQVLKNYADGTSAYVDVYDKVKANGDYDDSGNLVYETITFEGKPGVLVYKDGNIDVPSKVIGTDANGKAVYGLDQAALNTIYNKLEPVKFDIDWFVNPYVQIPAGGGQFYAGFKLYTDGTRQAVRFNRSAKNATGAITVKDGEGNDVTLSAGGGTGLVSNKYQLKWAIPIGWNFYF